MSRQTLLLALFAAPLAACAGTREPADRVAVTVSVDYGSAAREASSERLLVRAGSTPIDALAAALPVENGFVCCTKNDVWSVDGIPVDFEDGHFWVWELNGRLARLAPDRYRLRNGDHVTWVYAHIDEPPDHER